ncbi:thioesterase family protein [Aciduricibacillus chroicocephali]|uniref:Thioesterase family protein n=1 Tax=Aciduricibacillus chroicocephali TaxID=3054939 RepID=A0ABY9KYE9_9BACI|nr:thioesterase family protein [Bacillaceae bacterium 44XB]
MHVVKTPIEVRYQETDQMGVVYHANYLVWFEIARTKFIESLGFSYADMEKEGIVSPVTDIQVSYLKPVKYGDIATVETWLASYDGIRSVYAYNVKVNDEKFVTGSSEHVIVKKDGFRPVSLRKKFPDWHEAYQANVME